MYFTIDIQTEYTTLSVFESFDFQSRIKFTKYPTIYTYDLAVATLKKKLKDLVSAFGEPETTAISITGLVDKDTQVMIESAYLYEYDNKDIKKEVKNITNSDVLLEQDCVLDAYAELSNLGKDLDEYALITVTYGIGGVYIRRVGEKIHVFPTELGHTIVVPNGLLCSCGQRGCVEAYIGGENIKDRFLVPPEKIMDMLIWEEAVDYLAIATTNLMMCFPTKNVIYSGSSISTIPFLKNKIKNQVKKRMIVYPQPKIRISALSNKANSLGALKFIELTNNKTLIRIH